jgi:flavin-dependent dehydrogenase
LAHTLGPLQQGHVVIIGGGPGGTACALALRRMAAQMDRQVQVTIVEGKQFVGEMHYNQCVGVLSPPLPDLLWDYLEVKFPYHLSHSEISRYVLHTAREQITLSDNGQPSIALRRVQYDAYMLEQAQKQGITVIPARAMDMEFHDDKVVVYTENSPIIADVVVGAFGMDEGSSAMFTRLTRYQPPKALSSIVTKYHPSEEEILDFGPCIHAFLPPDPRIEFGGVTAKRNHLTINIAGTRIEVEDMQRFLRRPEVVAVLPNFGGENGTNPDELQFYKGHIPRSLARNYFGDRYVLVGDAAGLVRAFKGKGVTFGVLTGIRAAQTILQHGISNYAFFYHYRGENEDITQDLPYGQGMRLFANLLSRFQLLDPVIRVARDDPRLQSALFDAVSAHAPYRQVIRQSMRMQVIWNVMRSLVDGK